MKLWHWLSAVVCVGAVGFMVAAQDAGQKDARPTWKAFDNFDTKEPKLGIPFYQELKTETSQTMRVQGMDVTQKQTQTFWVKWTPLKADASGWEVEYEIVGVKMNIDIGGNNIDYDSTAKNPPPQNPLTDFFKALIGAKFTLKVAKDEKDGIRVVDVTKGLDDFVNKLAAANEQLKPLLKSILNKEAFKQMSNPTFAAFPKTDAEWTKGEWKFDNVKLDMGPIGTYTTDYTYTRKADKNTIEVSGKMTYKQPDSKDAGGLPFIIKKGDLTAEKISGSVTLNPEKGRVEKSEIKMDLKGNLTIDIAGMETQVELNQTQKSWVTTSDTDPTKK